MRLLSSAVGEEAFVRRMRSKKGGGAVSSPYAMQG
jgi:hypothetical protein